MFLDPAPLIMQASYLVSSLFCTRDLTTLSYGSKMVAEFRKLKQVLVRSHATHCSAICVPDRPAKPLLPQVFVQKEQYVNVGPVKRGLHSASVVDATGFEMCSTNPAAAKSRNKLRSQ